MHNSPMRSDESGVRSAGFNTTALPMASAAPTWISGTANGSGLGVTVSGEEDTTIYEVLVNEAPIEDAIVKTDVPGLDVVPSHQRLVGAEVELVSMMARELRLRKAIESIRVIYDYILIDCPPSLGLLTLNGLVAAQDGIIIPVQCEYLALEGLGQLTQTIYRVRDALFPTLTIRGVLLTMFDSRTNLSNDVLEEVRRFFPDQVFESVIPRSVRLAEAPSYGQPISLYDPGSTGAEAYQSLAEEILQNDGHRVPSAALE